MIHSFSNRRIEQLLGHVIAVQLAKVAPNTTNFGTQVRDLRSAAMARIQTQLPHVMSAHLGNLAVKNGPVPQAIGHTSTQALDAPDQGEIEQRQQARNLRDQSRAWLNAVRDVGAQLPRPRS